MYGNKKSKVSRHVPGGFRYVEKKKSTGEPANSPQKIDVHIKKSTENRKGTGGGQTSKSIREGRKHF